MGIVNVNVLGMYFFIVSGLYCTDEVFAVDEGSKY
jgi:hypothetical protein